MRLTFLWIVLTTIMNFLSTWYKYPWFLATPGGWHLLFWVKKLDEWIDCHHVWYRHSCSLDQLILLYTSWNCRFSRLWTCVEDRGTPDCSYIGLEWVLFSVWTTYHFPQWVQVWPAVFVLLGTLFRSVCERYCTWHVGWFRVMWVFVLFMCRAYRFVLMSYNVICLYIQRAEIAWLFFCFFCFFVYHIQSHSHCVWNGFQHMLLHHACFVSVWLPGASEKVHYYLFCECLLDWNCNLQPPTWAINSLRNALSAL